METIGFIGLGLMGRPMARNLLKAGRPLVVHNRSSAAVEELAATGARVASSPFETAQAAGIVITMLPDSPDVMAVCHGPRGIFAGARPGTLLIDMSTIAPAVARDLAAEAEAKGLAMLDAPVSGGTAGAAAGTLSVMVGGPADALERARPVLEVLGKTITHVGAAGAGQVAKVCNQVVVALSIEAVGEAFVLAERAGVDPGRVREALLGGFAHSRVLEAHGRRILDRDFAPGFKASLQLKDLMIAIETGYAYGVPLPATGVVAELYKSLCASGAADADHSALAALLARLAGLDWTGGPVM
jgi:2-hydroxy-3-oxopropionate reductase